MSKKAYSKKELMIYVWHRTGKDVAKFVAEFSERYAMDSEGNPMVDDEGYFVLNRSEIEQDIERDNSIVREFLIQNDIDQRDWLVIGIDDSFDAEMVDYLKCDPVVPKREVWAKYVTHRHERKLAHRRYVYLQRKSRDLAEKQRKEQSRAKRKGKA